MHRKENEFCLRYLEMTEDETRAKIEDALTNELGRLIAISQDQWETAVHETLKDIRVHNQFETEYVWLVLKTMLFIMNKY